jgi:hypothetical protein
MSILEIIGLAWICILAFNFITLLFSVRRGDDILEQAIKKTVENKVREIYVDVINSDGGQAMFLVYDAQTNDFLGQGSSHEEMVENLKKRFPDKIFAISQKNLSKIAS